MPSVGNECRIKMSEVNLENKDNLLFIAQDTLNEIRENKKDQRATTYNFIIITGILFGLFETLKSKFGVQIPNVVLKLFVLAFGGVTVYLLIRFQITLSQYRKRISIIWDERSFEFAFKKEILKYKNNCKAQYYSFWNNFFSFTFVYIMLVALITLLICVLL
jgi:hypothetical protein